MRINNISNYKYSSFYNKRLEKPSFKSSYRSVYNDNFTLKYNTNTCFFRSDMDWVEFVNYLAKKYKKTKKVNIINYACSTGEEPTSLAAILKIKLGENANKFFPIKAFDIEEENIRFAKTGLFNLSPGELDLVTKNLGDKYKEYFKVLYDMDNTPVWLSSSKKLESNIIYNQSDILKDIHKIPSVNTVLLCRNFLPYLTIGEQKDLIKFLGKHLCSSSLVVLGNFEISYGVEKLFEQEGFRHTKQYNIMEKMTYPKAVLTRLMSKLRLR